MRRSTRAEVAAMPERDIIFVDDDLNGYSRKAKQRCSISSSDGPGAPPETNDHAGRSISATTTSCRVWRGGRLAGVFIDSRHRHCRWRSSGRMACLSGGGSFTTARTSRASASTASRRGLVHSRDRHAEHGHDRGRHPAVRRVDLDGLNPTILTTAPGTRDYKRYDAEDASCSRTIPPTGGEMHARLPVRACLTSGAG